MRPLARGAVVLLALVLPAASSIYQPYGAPWGAAVCATDADCRRYERDHLAYEVPHVPSYGCDLTLTEIHK